MLSELDKVVSRSLTRFVGDISSNGWSGRREREAINLYVLGYLRDEVQRRGPIRDMTQIGIEVPVKQIDLPSMKALSGRAGAKECVAKDLVIWPRPWMTCWDESGKPSRVPLAILEWKFGRGPSADYDLEWLLAYSRSYPKFVGYTIRLSRTGRGFALIAVRVHQGRSCDKWLELEGAGVAP